MDKQTLLAFVLIAFVILMWPTYMKWLGMAPEEEVVEQIDSTAFEPVQEQDTGEPELINPPDEHDEISITGKTGSPDAAARPVSDLREKPVKDTADFAEPEYTEEIVTVETDYFVAKLSSYGAGLISFALKPTQTYIKKNIELLPENALPRPAFRFWTYEGPFDTNKQKYLLEDGYFGNNIRVSGSDKAVLRFTAHIAEGKSLTMKYTFKGEGFTFLYEVEGGGLENTWVRPDAEAMWQNGLKFTEPDTAQDHAYSNAFIYYSGDILESLNINKKDYEKIGPTTGDTRWGAVRTKYFVSSLIPESGKATGAWMESQVDSTYSGKNHPNRLGFGLLIPIVAGEPYAPVRVFIGPLDDTILSNIDPSLKKTMSFGIDMPVLNIINPIIKPLSRLILFSLKQLHSVIPNYGICIIIFSILIKLVIWPLTRKSYQSMAAMQRIQPKLKELKEKYKNDQQKLQKATWDLYKQEKVNPMGGCLPMLLQMPLLYALFIVFRATIEFRRAPFFLWINDLSLPDTIMHLPFSIPLYGDHVAVLPLIMGLTTFFQSKSTMTDPTNKAMLYFMPIFLTLIFNQFPSGLTLYYTLFNVWTIVQQKMTPAPAPAAAESNNAVKKK